MKWREKFHVEDLENGSEVIPRNPSMGEADETRGKPRTTRRAHEFSSLTG